MWHDLLTCVSSVSQTFSLASPVAKGTRNPPCHGQASSPAPPGHPKERVTIPEVSRPWAHGIFAFLSIWALDAIEDLESWKYTNEPIPKKNISGDRLFILCHPVARSPLFDGYHLGVTTRLYQFSLSWDENP